MRYIVAGGVAANLHGSVRATKEVDILVPIDLANMERLLEALAQLPWRAAAELVRKPLTIVGDDPRVDVLTVAWTVTFVQAWPNRKVRTIHGIRVPYLSLADLTASKQTGRPSDEADLAVLEGAQGVVASTLTKARDRFDYASVAPTGSGAGATSTSAS